MTAKFRRPPSLVSECLLYMLLSDYSQRVSPFRISVAAYFSFLPLQISLSLSRKLPFLACDFSVYSSKGEKDRRE